ncbi:uncharacterized protein [Manis javanica]|uniref:uncharacterized protein isoform X3 n=1 Tax=Manis javanica TaxID=9974 RepID=UPI003C6D0E92
MKSYGEEVHRDIHVSLRAVSLLLETRRLGVGCAAVLPGPPCAASPPQALRISSCHSGTVSSVCLFMSYSHELFSVRKQQVSGKLPSILAPVRTQLGPSWHFLPAPGPQQATSPRQFFPARPYPGRHLHSDLLPTRAQEPVGLPSEVQFEARGGLMREEGALGTIAVETVSRPRVCWVVLSIDSPTLCIIPSEHGKVPAGKDTSASAPSCQVSKMHFGTGRGFRVLASPGCQLPPRSTFLNPLWTVPTYPTGRCSSSATKRNQG